MGGGVKESHHYLLRSPNCTFLFLTASSCNLGPPALLCHLSSHLPHPLSPPSWGVEEVAAQDREAAGMGGVGRLTQGSDRLTDSIRLL